jgi:hypothetical protein
MSSAHDHRKSGKRQPRPKREPSIDANLICFLEVRRHTIDFRSAKNQLDDKRVE